MKSITILCLILAISAFAYGDQQQCIDAINQISETITKIQKDVSSFNIAALSKDVTTLQDQVQYALTVCQQSEEQTNDIPTCIQDIENIALTAAQLEKDYKAFNIIAMTKDVEALIAEVKKAQTDCKANDNSDQSWKFNIVEVKPVGWEKLNDIATCIQDIEKIAATAQQLENDLKSFNIVALTKDVQALYTEVQSAQNDCKLADIKSPEFQDIITQAFGLSDIATCIQDIEKIAVTAQQLEKDLKAFNVIALTKDVQQLYAEVQQAQQDCKTQQKVELQVSLEDIATCIQDIEKIAVTAEQLDKDLKAYNIVAIAKDAEALYAEVKQAQVDCKSNSDLLSSSQYGDIAQCIQACEQIVNTAYQLEQDFKAHNVIAIAKDVDQLYNETESALQYCKQSEN